MAIEFWKLVVLTSACTTSPRELFQQANDLIAANDTAAAGIPAAANLWTWLVTTATSIVVVDVNAHDNVSINGATPDFSESKPHARYAARAASRAKAVNNT